MRQPWINSSVLDSLVILAPSFVSVGFAYLFEKQFGETEQLPAWAWVSFVLLIDVAHVYGTVFRTYFHSTEFKTRRKLLTLVPLFCWIGGVLLYSVGELVFWRVLAYLAVFHFIRQQYGFMMLYSRNESEGQRKFRWIDQGFIYSATLYPLFYWHTHLPRNFNWFVEGDFVTGVPPVLSNLALVFEIVFGSLFLTKEFYSFLKTGFINIPKLLFAFGTALSWLVGIVVLKGDMAFTVSNVVSHGIPYLGLVWMTGRKQVSKTTRFSIYSLKGIPLFLGVLFLFAYLEEGLWAGWVWREHLEIFAPFSNLPFMQQTDVLVWLVPFLILPQSTHYVLDGFIWKLREKRSDWSITIFREGVQAS